MLNFAPPIISDGMRYIKNTFAVQSFIHCATNNVIYTSAYIIKTMSYTSISLKKNMTKLRFGKSLRNPIHLKVIVYETFPNSY